MTPRAILVLATAACGSRTAPPAAADRPATRPAAPTAPHRATFHALPAIWQALDALEVAPGAKLVVGASGQRWMVTTTSEPTDADPDATRTTTTAASAFAPEDLVAVRRRGSAYLFVGASGATYVAANPLDDFTARRLPPERLRAAAAGKQAIVGITLHDTLVRSLDDGATWAPIATPKSAAIPLAVAASRAGEALMIASPGQLWASLDDLATFQPVATGGLGPGEVLTDVDGKVWLRGLAPSTRSRRNGLAILATTHGVLKRAADGTAAIESKRGFPTLPVRDGDEDLGFADGVQRGEAVWTGRRYLELKPARDPVTALHAVVVHDDAVEHRGAIAAATDCTPIAIAADGNLVEAECAHDAGGYRTALLLRSVNFGATFVADGEIVSGTPPEHHLWVSAKGSVIADSSCLAPQPDCGEEGLVVRVHGSSTFVSALMPPGLHAHVLRLRMSADGQRVYAVGYDQNNAKLVLLISQDGGRSFDMKAMPDPDGNVLYDASELALDEATHTVVLISEAYRLATRDDGDVWEVGKLPFAADAISIAAKRGLATTGRGIAWETRDSGETWTEVAIPPASPRGTALAVACSEQACMLGDVAIRDGWELATDADVKPVAPVAAKPPAHRPVVECNPDGGEIELGASMTPVSLEPAPGLAWFAAVEAADGALDVVTVARGAKAIARTPLMPAPKAPAQTRKEVAFDGAIAIRSPRDAPDVDVAWWVAATGRVYRGKLANARQPTGKPLSGFAAIAPGYGLYVHLGDLPTFIVRETGATEVMPGVPAFPSVATISAHRVGARTVFFGWPTSILRDRTLAIASLPDARPVETFSTFTWGLWPRLVERTRVAAASVLADQVIVAWPGNDDIAPHTWSVALKDAAPQPPEPVALPTAKDELAACASAAIGTRVGLPWVAGSRTPIVVKTGGARTLHLATENVVARVGKSACAIGIEAASPNVSLHSEVALVRADDMRGFAFTMRSKTQVGFPIACAATSSALPAAYANAKGM